MSSQNLKVIFGFIILISAIIIAFTDSIPFIWVGGFIWGILLVVQGLQSSEEDLPIISSNDVSMTNITCTKCTQKLRVPLNWERYDIKCSTCKKSPFADLEKSKF